MSTRDLSHEDWRARALDLLAIDLRSLAFLRIGLGCLLLVDLALRLPSYAAFYSDTGVLPRSVAREWLGADAALSLHLLLGAGWVQGALWSLAAAASVALVIGWHSRLAALLSFVLLLSLHQRNPMILSGADNFLRYLLFWSIFLPLGEHASVDARARRDPQLGRGRALSVATFGIQVQVCLIYW